MNLFFRDITNAFLLTYQLGGCCIYVVFVASNIKDIVDYFIDDELDVRLFMLIILLPLILINWVCNCLLTIYDSIMRCSAFCLLIVLCFMFNVSYQQVRNLKYLAPFSTVANAVTIVSFGIICYYMFRDPITTEGKHSVGTLRQFPLFFGTVL